MTAHPSSAAAAGAAPDSPDPVEEVKQLLDHAVSAVGGRRRDGQVAMTAAVAAAMANSRHLCVQAGTGTGKSLAYLVPAVRHALSTDSAIVVSTATLALQRQLIERDLPRLVAALAEQLPREASFAVAKGRSHYLCLRKYESQLGLLEEDLGEDLGGELGETSGRSAASSRHSDVARRWQRLHSWAEKTTTGDRDELQPGVPDELWRSVSVTAEECIGAALCPVGQACFAEQAKAAAELADIVVTNHALLAIDAAADYAVLPPHSVTIVDEAHELEARVTAVMTQELSGRMLELSKSRVTSFGSVRAAEAMDAAATDLDSIVYELPLGRISTIDDNLAQRLAGIAQSIRYARSQVAAAPESEASSDPEKHAERAQLAHYLLSLADAVDRALQALQPEDDDPATAEDVVFSTERSSGARALAVAPLQVRDLLRQQFFDEGTVILTSATLALGGRFDAMAAQWGLTGPNYDVLDVGTPFQPEKSGILYTAAHLPPPGRDGLHPDAIEEIYQLIMAAGGRTLGLFSSRRAAIAAAEALRERVPYEILLQGEDSLGSLVQEFSTKEQSCLFGTLSLWQGVDVPGPSCSVVIMDRIPFPRPDNPLLQARAEAADAAGRSGFMEVSATHAALLMAQGAGRLLRATTDRGVVAVLDSRLETKRYGAFIRRSLPNFWRTTDPAVVRGALTRLVNAAPGASPTS